MNPNNCKTCDHKKIPDGGWCYMFGDEPDEVCMQHTARGPIIVGRTGLLKAVLAASLRVDAEVVAAPAKDKAGET